ncbi:MAG: polyphosphate kinase 2 [Planctomycetota bacterium]
MSDILPFDLDEELDRAYLEELAELQLELLELQAHVLDSKQRVLIVVEGRDAAGKGGAILRFTQNLNPRHHRVVSLPKPSPTEQKQWYFQRYLKHLPDPGQVVFFDRSWYNRGVVEPVFGFCTEAERLRFLDHAVLLERMLVEDGLTLIKLWFSIDRQVQAERLAARERNPLRRWKLSPIDRAAQANWDQFTRFKEATFAVTATPACPWTVVQGNEKKTARLEAIRHVLSRIPYPARGARGVRLEPDPEVVTVLTGPQPAR